MTYPHHGEGSDTQQDSASQVVQGLTDANANNASDGSQSLAEEPSTDNQTQQQQANDAPYAKYLAELPESVRPLVEPHYKQWDRDVASKLQSLHSEYAPYKPLFDEYEPDALQDAVRLIQALETDPQGFLQRLQSVYGGAPNEQGSADQSNLVPDADNPDVGNTDPRIGQLEQLVQTMAEQMIAQRQQSEQQQYAEQLDLVMGQLHTQHGDFDDNYVLTLISQGVDPNQAVQQYNQIVEQAVARVNAPAANAPTVIGSGGGYPSQVIDPGKLDNKGAKDLVVQMLAQSAAQEQ